MSLRQTNKSDSGMQSTSIFTRIMSGEITGDIVFEDEHCVVLNDLHPQAPVHLLVIPRKPLISLAEIEANDVPLLGHLLLIAKQVAQSAGIEKGFRVIANNGSAAGQTVFHLHFHVLGGSHFSETALNP